MQPIHSPNPAPEIVLDRESRAWQLRQQGWSQMRIAKELGIDQSTVSRLLQRISDRVLAELQENVERVKVEQTVQLEHLYDEALQAWERSKQDAVKITTETPPAEREGASNATVTEEVKGQVGDRAYLDEARAVLADIRKIWGLDSAKKIDTTSNGETVKFYAGFSPDDV
jgi:predicted transcriptional regulator